MTCQWDTAFLGQELLPKGAAPGRTAPSGLGATERRILNPRPLRVFRKS